MKLYSLTDGLCRDFAHVGVAVARAEDRAIAAASAEGLGRLDATAPFRVASISKIVVGQVAAQVFGAAWDTDLSEVLGFSLRPDGAKVTLRQMLSHASGLSDAGGYALDPSRRLKEALTDAVWTAAPGERFEYCNLGYIILAAAIEARAGASFPKVAHDLGWPSAFNWWGVDHARRNEAVPIFRRGPDGFEPQIDHAIGTAEVARGCGAGLALSDIRNPAGFSPQGGLRASLTECLTLACRIPAMDATALWTGRVPDPLFDHYGAGLMILATPGFYPRPLIGHFANAYGLCGGVWHDPEVALSFAYVLNGLAMGEEDDALRPAERAIFQAIAKLA